MDTGWSWDPTLYGGSAAHYARGRVAYTAELVERLAAELGLDGRGQLLDAGCGPGSLTLLLAPHVEHATGVDADPEMLAVAGRAASAHGITNTDWIHLRAEELPTHLGPFRIATLAQSFHWMDRPLVARLLHGLLGEDGSLVHVHATTHQGIDGDALLPHPRPPRREIDDLVRTFLGTDRRAGRGRRSAAPVDEAERGTVEAEIYRAAGFGRHTRFEVPGQVVTRTADEVVASVFSLSYAAPHLFGERAAEFEAELRALLAATGPEGLFGEEMRETAIDLWRVGSGAAANLRAR